MSKFNTIEEFNTEIHKYHPEIDVIKVFTDKYLIDCRCNKCNQVFEKRKDKLKQGCPVCSNQKLVQGVNDMATTAPWMLKYLSNKSDGYEYMKSSNKKILFKCPDCSMERMIDISHVYAYGYTCTFCGDKISKPNKFIRNLLPCLPVENVMYEYISSWTNGKKYDAYFEYNDKKYVVEMDGDQHRENSEWGDAQVQKINDAYKDELAKNNGVYMIRIDCHRYDYQAIIEQFMQSDIGSLIEKNHIDWNRIIKKVESNLFHKVCEFYKSNPNLKTSEIAKEFNISRHTVYRYLVQGNLINLCEYRPISNKRKKEMRLCQLIQ